MAEGKALASNSLCVAGRDAAGPCAGAIGTSETEHSGRLFIWAFMMWFFGRQVFVPPPNLLIHRPRHIGQDARPIHNRPLPRLSTTAASVVREIVPDRLRHCYPTPPNSLVSRPFLFFDLTGIAAYCKPENKVSLGFVEGLNNKIRDLQRRAYGLRNEEYLRLKVLTCMLPAL